MFGCTFGHKWEYAGALPTAPRDQFVAIRRCRRCGREWYQPYPPGYQPTCAEVLFGEKL